MMPCTLSSAGMSSTTSIPTTCSCRQSPSRRAASLQLGEAAGDRGPRRADHRGIKRVDVERDVPGEVAGEPTEDPIGACFDCAAPRPRLHLGYMGRPASLDLTNAQLRDRLDALVGDHPAHEVAVMACGAPVRRRKAIREVGMRVDVKHPEPAMVRGERAHDGQGDRVIAAEDEGEPLRGGDGLHEIRQRVELLAVAREHHGLHVSDIGYADAREQVALLHGIPYAFAFRYSVAHHSAARPPQVVGPQSAPAHVRDPDVVWHAHHHDVADLAG